MKFRESQTFQNLTNAFAGESQARNRYNFYAGIAAKEGYAEIKRIFEETADNEREHAKMFFKLLLEYSEGVDTIHVDADYPLAMGDTLSNLKAAAEGEHEEWSVLYSKFGDIAKEEGYPEIGVVFHKIAEVEKHHEERFKHRAEGLEKGTLHKKDTETQWKCENCGYVHEGKEAPEKCPACRHGRGYFKEIPEKY